MAFRRSQIAAFILPFTFVSSGLTQNDYAHGGLAGVVRDTLNEAVENGHISEQTRDDILPAYEKGQELLGRAFHSSGVTPSAAIRRGSGLAGQVQRRFQDAVSRIEKTEGAVKKAETPEKTIETTNRDFGADTLVLPERQPVSPDFAINAVRQSVFDELLQYCSARETLREGPNALQVIDPQTIFVALSDISCSWDFINHPFCGARYCTVRTYSVSSNGSVSILSEELR